MIYRRSFSLKKIAFVLLALGTIAVWGFIQNNLQAAEMKVLEGQLLDQGGRPASQYPIKLDGVAQLAGKTYIAVTDFSGRFQFFNLAPGEYVVYPVRQPERRTIELIKGETLNIEPLRLDKTISINLNPEAAMTINTEAAMSINPEAAMTINPEAAMTINPEAAMTINPEAAKVLIPDLAKILTEEEARTISPLEASKPLPK